MIIHNILLIIYDLLYLIFKQLGKTLTKQIKTHKFKNLEKGMHALSCFNLLFQN